jgi:hypothetical protein
VVDPAPQGVVFVDEKTPSADVLQSVVYIYPDPRPGGQYALFDERFVLNVTKGDTHRTREDGYDVIDLHTGAEILVRPVWLFRDIRPYVPPPKFTPRD